MSTIEKTTKVEGMMCGHCEAHVKEALEKIKGVEEATADHETGKVVLKLSKEIASAFLQAMIGDDENGKK